MTTHGPWLTQPVRSASLTYPIDLFTGPGDMRSLDGHMAGFHLQATTTPPATFADACEAPTDDGISVGIAESGAFVFALNGTVTKYQVQQYFVRVDWVKFRTVMLNAYMNPLPRGVTVEYEQLDGSVGTSPPFDVTQMRGGSLSIDLTLNPQSVFPGGMGAEEFYLPAAGTLQATGYDVASEGWLPGASVASRSVRGSVTFTSAYDQAATLAATVGPTDWATSSGSALIRYSFDAQVSHTSMTPGAGPTDLEQGWGPYMSPPSAVRLTSDYQPPRFRFVYDRLPPLRQYPRDDSLGGAPRQGTANGSRSVQASTRQGWRNTYR